MRFFLDLGKYWQLLVFVFAFLVLESVILGINFYDSFQIERDAHAIQLSGRQGVLSQTILTSLYEVKTAVESDQDYSAALEKLSTAFFQFDEALDAFLYGGTMIGVGQGNDALLEDSAYRELNEELLVEIEEYWTEYRQLLQPVVYSPYDDLLTERALANLTQQAFDYGRQINPEFLPLIESFAGEVEAISQDNSARTRNVQTLGIALVAVFFVVLVFFFLRRLIQSDRVADAARKETGEILETVEEGLFLLDASHQIGNQYSASLESLFRNKNLAGRDFMGFIAPKVSEATAEVAQSYIDLLFRPHVKEKLVTDLNPLSRVEIIFESGADGFDVRHLAFSFKRVLEKAKILHLLVSVRDISEQVRLESELEASTQRASREMELLLSLLQVDPSLARDFLTSARQVLDQINAVLEAPGKTEDRLRLAAQTIFRLAHRLKGDCATVGLKNLQFAVHDLEENLVRVSAKSRISGSDFIPVTIQLNELLRTVDQLENLMDRMSNFDTSVGKKQKLASVKTLNRGLPSKPEPAAESIQNPAYWHKTFTRLAAEVSSDYQKQVKVEFKNFDLDVIPDQYLQPFRDIAVQLVRNSVAHGIEMPAVRISEGKSPVGRIHISAETAKGHALLRIRDDGQGLDLEEIRRRAIEKGLLNPEQAEQADALALSRIIFKSAFSTRNAADQHAGRGVGLDLVRDTVRKYMGAIGVKTKRHQFTEFVVRLPNAEQTLNIDLAESV